jgi:hypothetical protein
MNLRLKIATTLALAATATTYADIKINDNLTFSGYAVGALMNYKPNNGVAVNSLFDASKPIPGGGDANDVLTKFTMTFKPVTGVLSLNYFPNAADTNGTKNELTVLDAYAVIDAGSGTTVTIGKYLSYLGYESFYPSLMDQVSYGSGDFLAPIPGYHTGAKIDYSANGFGAGASLHDSTYSPYGPTRGDGEIRHNGGAEGYLTYTGITNLTLWGGFGYDTQGGFQPHSVTTLDFWASYNLTKQLRVAGEYVNKDGGTGNKGWNWLGFLDYSFDDHVSAALRVGGDQMANGGPRYTKYTVCPAYAINANFLVRAEYSYYKYSRFSSARADFWGLQTVFKF